MQECFEIGNSYNTHFSQEKTEITERSHTHSHTAGKRWSQDLNPGSLVGWNLPSSRHAFIFYHVTLLSPKKNLISRMRDIMLKKVKQYPQVHTTNAANKWQSSAWLMLTHVLRMLCDIVWLVTHIQGVVQFQGAKVGRPHRVAAAAAAFHPISSHSWPKKKNLREGCRAGGHTLTAAPHILRAKEDNRGSWAHESRPSFFVLGTLSIVHIRLVHRAFAKK